MKKMILLSMFALGAWTINAQTPVIEGGGFWDNWSMGLQGGGTMKMSGTGFFKSARPAFGLTIGKQWTPILGTDIQGMGYINTTNSKTMIDASDVSLIARMNLMNLFGGYEGMPRPFEIETATGLGWLHHYMNGAGDTDDLAARVGLNFNFNLGEDAAWTIGIKPAVVFNLTGEYPSKKMAFNKNHANMEILLGFTYHFADMDGNRHFQLVNAVDPVAMDAINEEVNDLRALVAAKDVELAGLADELLLVQNQLNEARNKQVQASGQTINLDDIAFDVEKEELIGIARTSLSGKGSFTNIDSMATKLVEALLNVEENGEIDEDMIKIRQIYGEGTEDTEITESVTVDKNVLESEMPKDVKNAKICLLQYPIDARELQNEAKIKLTTPGEYQAYLDKEAAMLEEEVQKIVDAGANVLFNNKKISDLGQHYLTKAGILAVKRVKTGDLERLSKATGANIVNNIRELTSDDIGEAGHVYEREVFWNREYIFVEECKYSGTLNVIVRGSTKHITGQLEQAIKDAIGAVSQTIKNKKALPGGGAADIAAAKVLKKYANTFTDKRQLAIRAYAEALEQLPLALAHNAGMDMVDVLTDLLAAQEKSTNMGVNVLKREVSDMREDKILDSHITKKAIVDSATEIAGEILRIDDVVASKPETPVGGDMPGTPNPYL